MTPPPAASGTAPACPAEPPLILIVDDDSEARDILRLLMTDMGYRVVTAVDGAQAVQQTRTLQPQVVLADLLMPVMDGIAMAKVLRSDPLTVSIPLVLCSGISERRVQSLFKGYDAYLEKPYEGEELQRILQRLAPLGSPQSDTTPMGTRDGRGL